MGALAKPVKHREALRTVHCHAMPCHAMRAAGADEIIKHTDTDVLSRDQHDSLDGGAG